MDTLLLACAGLGGTFLVLQLVAGLVGAGGDHAPDHDAAGGPDGADGHDHGNEFLGLLTVRSVAAAVTFFGLGGLTARYYGAETPAVLAAALFGGTAALYAVAWLMKGMHRLKHDGTARIDRAVGQTGTVYLRVPAANAGPGKVHLSLQSRTVELLAVTPGPELPTGAAVRVTAVLTRDTVQVEPV